MSALQLYAVRILPSDAEAMTPVAFQGRPRIEALLGAIADQIQVIEESAYDVLVSTSIASASGDALDQWGDLVGEPRGDLIDLDYRRFISARLLANRSGGTPDDLLAVWDLVTAPNTAIRYEPVEPAGFVLWSVRSGFMDDATKRRVARMMGDIKPAGVDMLLIEALTGGLGFDDPGSGWTGFDAGGFARIIS